jgi:hypothetical protein
MSNWQDQTNARAMLDEVRAAIQEVTDETTDGTLVADYALQYLLHRTAVLDPQAVRLLIDDLRSMAVRLRMQRFDDLADPGSGPLRSVPREADGA